MYNWYQLITAIIQHIYECKLQYILIITIYMAVHCSGIGCIYTHTAITYIHGAISLLPLLLLITPLAITYYSP
jgi:hypothetical protein